MSAGAALAVAVARDGAAVGSDGKVRGRGTNLFVLNGEGQIASVMGFWT